MIQLLFILTTTWFVTHFDIFQVWLNNQYMDLKSEFLQTKKPVAQFFTDIVYEIFTCWMCCAFWATLLVTQNIFYAFTLSCIAWILDGLQKK